MAGRGGKVDWHRANQLRKARTEGGRAASDREHERLVADFMQ